MKFSINTRNLALVVITLGSTLTLNASIIFEEDFSVTNTLPDIGQANIEGTFANITTSGISVDQDASIIMGEQLSVVNTTAEFRGIGITILSDDISLAGGMAGTYNFSFSLISLESTSPGLSQVSSDDVVVVDIFSGSGFDTGNTNDSLRLDFFGTELFSAQGNASVDVLASQEFSTPQDDLNVSFEYDGSGPIVVFLGVLNGSGSVVSDNGTFSGNPQPEAIFDNLTLTNVVPEPSTFISILIGSIFFIIRRHRV